MENPTACQRLLSSLSEYIDGTLSESLCEEIEKHMSGCENCQIVVDTVRKTIDLVQINCGPGEVPDEVRKRLFVRLNLEDYLEVNPES
jgi:mycothiol system anti-sigma-R factor